MKASAPLNPADFVGRWLSKQKAALWIDKSVRTINVYIAAGKVEWRYDVGGAVRIWEPSLWRDRGQITDARSPKD